MCKAPVQRFCIQCISAARQLDSDCPRVNPPPTVATPVNLQTLPPLPYRMLPDNCQFELLDVDALQDPASGRLLHLYSLVARCLSCETVFKAEEGQRSEEHTSELQSQSNLVCRLLLEKKKKRNEALISVRN